MSQQPPSSVDNDLSGELVTPDQSDADSSLNLEQVGGHGKGRDLGHNPMYDGRNNPQDPRTVTDRRTGQQVRESTRGGMEDQGYQAGERVAAERTVSQGGNQVTGWTVTAVKIPGPGVTGMVGAPTPLLGEDVRRGYTRISNVGTDAVLLGSIGQLNAGVGFQLSPGQAFEPQTTAAIWVIQIQSGASLVGAPVSVWAERHA